MKRIIIFILILLNFSFLSLNIAYGEDQVLSKDNILMKAFAERKKRLFDIIEGGELNKQIKDLKIEIKKIEQEEKLDSQVKQKILEEISIIEKSIEEKNKKIEGDREDLEKFLNEAKKSIEIKNALIDKLNKQIEDNKIAKEKNAILLEDLSKKQQEEEDKLKKQNYYKYYIFFGFSIFLFLIHLLVYFAVKYEKIKKERGSYINFFLIFGYILFLIWFFFYLYPELSIFLIFISGYLLAINAHLIASFVGSIIILEKYKIGNVIKFGDFRGQIIRITTINTLILPMTKEGIFVNKPIIIPNYKLLKEEVQKDLMPSSFLYNYSLVVSLDLELDILKLVEAIEQNILIKHLNIRLNTIAGNEESFRTSISTDRYGRIEIIFTWKGDDILNKRIERKIIGLYTKMVEQKKKELKEEKEKEKEKKEEEKKEDT